MHSVTTHDHPPQATARLPEAAGSAPGVVLALLACLPIAGTLLVAQVLPQLEQAFAETPGVRLRVSIALTIPALMIAIFSWGAGWLADRVGKRRLLLIALVAYAVFGLAPMVLGNLDAIIGVRAGMGVAESIIMTCSTALIGDFYAEDRRQRLLSMQTAFASIAAVIFAVLGGVLGNLGWRAPFGVYALAVIVLPAVLFLVPAGPDTASSPAAPAQARVKAALPYGVLGGICIVTFVLSLCFYVAQIQIPYLLNGLGAVSPGTVGLVSSLTNVAVVCGSLSFVLFRRLPLRLTSLLCFVLFAAGLGTAGIAHGYGVLCLGLVIASFSGGIALPTFLNAAMALLTPEQRGAGTGLWQSSFWGGQFLSPILVVALTAATGTLTAAVTAMAGVALVVGGLLSVWLMKSPRP